MASTGLPWNGSHALIVEWFCLPCMGTSEV
jgi:hypothetical protein